MGGSGRKPWPGVRISMALMAYSRRKKYRSDQPSYRATKSTPDSRRIIVSAWNVGEIQEMALPPCHAFFQFYVAPAQPEKGLHKPQLSCQLYQRSADIFLGVPFNIASYALLTLMVAQVCDMQPAEFVHTLGDAHIYSNHFEQTELQLSRAPKPLPTMHINPNVSDIFSVHI